MVVKKTYLKVIIKEIKGSFGRFSAIFGIVFLGVGLLSGLISTTPGMHHSVDEYYNQNNMADIFIKGTMGITGDDIRTLSAMDEIYEIMPAYVLDKLLETENNETLVTRIYGLPLIGDLTKGTNINKLQLISGRMPENPEECLIERRNGFLAHIPIGSKLIVSNENDEYDEIDDIFSVKEFTVVGIVGNSFHFANEIEVSSIGNGRLGSIIYVDEEAYSMDVYTDLYITANGVREMDSFSSRYEKKIEKIVEELEVIGEERSEIRYEEVLKEANDKLQDGREEYREAKEEAEKELSDAAKDLEEGRIELQDGYIELEDGKRKLADARITLEDEVSEANAKISDAKLELEDGLKDLQDGEIELADGLQELMDGQKKYQEGYAEYLDAKRELEDGQREFDKAERELKDAIDELKEGKRELAKGERELERGKKELEDAEYELEEGYRQLEKEKNNFFQGVDPLAKQAGFSSAMEFFSAMDRDRTGQIRNGFIAAINGIKGQLQAGIGEAESKKEQLEYAILDMEKNIQYLEQIPEEHRTDEDKAALDKLKSGLQEANQGIIQIDASIAELEAQLSQIPDPDVILNGWSQIKDGEKKLNDGYNQLEEGREEYLEGREELRKAKAEIEDGEKRLKDGEAELEENRQTLKDGWRELEDGYRELEDARISLEDGFKEYNEGKAELEDGWRDYYKGIDEVSDAEKELEDQVLEANQEISDAEKDIAKGEKDYLKGLREYKDGEIEYLDAKEEVERELADAEAELADAEREISEIEKPKWYVLDRNSNISYVSFVMNSEKVAAVSKVFPIFFYLVAALVSLTTMTRMIEEERIQIGTLKALGYGKASIMGKYVIYCGLASVLGCIVGLIVGFKLIPQIIYNAYGVLFHLPPFVTRFNMKIALTSSGMAVLSTIGVTIYACSEALKEKPATLMLPRAPKAGKRILLERMTFIWSKMSFNHKATARNIFRYKKHFIMTVVGIAGCTALLVAGFGIRDSLSNVPDIQFGEIYKYQVNIDLDEKKQIDEILTDILEDKARITDFMQVHKHNGYAMAGNKEEFVTIFVPDNINSVNEFIDFRDRKSEEEVSFDKSSIIVTEKIAETLGLSIGDSFLLDNDEGKIIELELTGITENYIGSYLYISREIYERAINEQVENNSMLIKTGVMENEERDIFISDFLNSEAVLNASFIDQTKGVFNNLINSVNYIVVVIIIASGLLAFIVLYNLTNININERRKELATLKVLGFHDEEVSSYIFREIRILTLIGMLLGLLLGKILHGFIIITIEDPGVMFGRNAKVLSYILSGMITFLFSFIVNIFMKKKLKNIKMVDSMKAND